MDEVVNEVPVTEVPATEMVVTAQPGEKTDSALLLKSLQEEREEKRELKAEIERLKTQTTPSSEFSDEGLLLKKEIDGLKAKDAQREALAQLSSLQTEYPALKDKQAEFDEYRTQNPGLPLSTAAKGFLIDHDLFEAPGRKGLERPSGGARVVPKAGMTAEDIADLRINDFRRYSKLLKDGKIEVE